MDQLFVVVVKDPVPGENLPLMWTDQPNMDRELRRKYQIAVWRAVQRNSKRCLNRDALLGIVAMLGFSLASWAGVAVLVSRLVR